MIFGTVQRGVVLLKLYWANL